MRGSIQKRGRSYALVFDIIDGATGIKKQKWQTFKPTGKTETERKAACQAKLNELLHGIDRGVYVEASQMTVKEWLDTWVERYVVPNMRTRSIGAYRHIIKKWLVPKLGAIRLQALRASHLRAYYADAGKTLGPASVRMHHAILSAALRAAADDEERLVPSNVARDMKSKPKAAEGHAGAATNVWTLEDARAFLVEARKLGPQATAFYQLALDSGMRKSELNGLRWERVDLDRAKVTVMEQLVSFKGGVAIFGPTKTTKPRTIDISDTTVALLGKHRQHQNELRLANSTHYAKLGLAFAREHEHLTTKGDKLGWPLNLAHPGEGEFGRLITAANVKRITFHGTRHTCATLLFLAGENVKVVQERLGHSRIEMTLKIYAHLLESAQQNAAKRLDAMLG